MAVGRVLTSVDQVADYVPVVSTFTNLVGLFQKCVVHPCLSQQTIKTSPYCAHLSQKSALRSIVLLLPVIGNLEVGVMDFIAPDEGLYASRVDGGGAPDDPQVDNTEEKLIYLKQVARSIYQSQNSGKTGQEIDDYMAGLSDEDIEDLVLERMVAGLNNTGSTDIEAEMAATLLAPILLDEFMEMPQDWHNFFDSFIKMEGQSEDLRVREGVD